MRHQVEKGTFSYENKERTKREKLVRTKWAFHRFGALTGSSFSLASLLRCMGKNFHYFCFFIPIVVEVECMDLHHSHYGNRFSIA